MKAIFYRKTKNLGVSVQFLSALSDKYDLDDCDFVRGFILFPEYQQNVEIIYLLDESDAKHEDPYVIFILNVSVVTKEDVKNAMRDKDAILTFLSDTMTQNMFADVFMFNCFAEAITQKGDFSPSENSLLTH